MFETITLTDEDEPLLASIRAYSGNVWSTPHELKAYRSRLLKLQNYRCAYCQLAIEADEVGHRELDHILPKLGTKNCTDENGRSNEYARRQHTYGYSQFTYEPLNMVVICKICNSYKKSFDPLRDRTNVYTSDTYPDPAAIQWFYPYTQRYSGHISRSENWTYTQRSPEGDYVIRVCRLDQAEGLSSRAAVRALIKARQAGSLRDAVMDLAGDVRAQRCSFDHAVSAVELAVDIDRPVANELIRLWVEFRAKGTMLLAEKAEALLVALVADEDIDTDDAAGILKVLTCCTEAATSSTRS